MREGENDEFEEVAAQVESQNYVKTDLTEGETYDFRIRAKNSVGFSEYSVVFSITAATVPSEPRYASRIESWTSET